MTNLLQLSTEAAALDDLLASVENPDTPEVQALIARMLDLTAEKEQKIDAYCGLIRELALRAEARKAEAERLSQRALQSEKLADNLKERLHLALKTMGIKKVETEHFTVSRVNNGGKIPLEVNDADVPDAYTELQTVVKIDVARIRKELEEGKALGFAKLGERGERLSIK